MLKRIIFLFVSCLVVLLIVNAKNDNEILPGINWDKVSHDFGSITEGEIGETVFTVTNNRKDTLIIENTMGSCGCVTYSWPHEPILPGKGGSFKVSFDSGGKSGNQMKSVSVYTNKGVYYLSLKANVIQK